MLYTSGSQPGVPVPLGVREKLIGGTQNSKNHSKESNMGRIFDLGVRKRATILIWGYAEGYSFDLGVRQYHRVENPCCKPHSNLLHNNNGQIYNKIALYKQWFGTWFDSINRTKTLSVQKCIKQLPVLIKCTKRIKHISSMISIYKDNKWKINCI